MDSGVNANYFQFRNLNTWKNKMIPQVNNVSDSVKHTCVHKKLFFLLRFVHLISNCMFTFLPQIHNKENNNFDQTFTGIAIFYAKRINFAALNGFGPECIFLLVSLILFYQKNLNFGEVTGFCYHQ